MDLNTDVNKICKNIMSTLWHTEDTIRANKNYTKSKYC